MGRFLAFLLVFALGGVVGFVAGGLGGAVAGAYVGACEVVDQAVADRTMTQEEANAVVKSVAAELDITPDQKTSIVERLKKSDAAAAPSSFFPRRQRPGGGCAVRPISFASRHNSPDTCARSTRHTK
jgi:hypothetical protein